MATNTTYYGLLEQAKRLDPDGKLATIVEVLNRETGNILSEAPWLPSNDTWTNKTLRRGTLPTSARRKLNAGVAKSNSRTTEIMDVIEMREVYAEYDKDYIDAFPEPGRARLMEAEAFLEGLGQDIASDILYCNSNKDPDGMHGIEPRLATLDGEFVIDGGGTGSDVTSIYVVTWGPNYCHLIYPKNMANLGIKHTDLGEVTITTATTGVASAAQFQGYRDHFQVKCGLVVRHPKCIGRVANIESSGSSNTFDNNDLVTLLNNMKIDASTRIYCNQTIKTQAEILMLDKANLYWTPEKGIDGQPFISFRGIPVRMIDKDILLNSETAIT